MQVITKLLYLQHQGEAFTQKEALEVFFAVTKLFQNSDPNLRRMMYLCMKEICPDSAEVMMVFNSLTKDMNSTQELYRANAIRVLRTMIDPSMLQQIERYFKQCIVDKSPVRTRLSCHCAPTCVHIRLSVCQEVGLQAAAQSLSQRAPLPEQH